MYFTTVATFGTTALLFDASSGCKLTQASVAKIGHEVALTPTFVPQLFHPERHRSEQTPRR